MIAGGAVVMAGQCIRRLGDLLKYRINSDQASLGITPVTIAGQTVFGDVRTAKKQQQIAN